MVDLLAPVLNQIHKLWSRVDRMPVVRWATVVQVSPLRVLLDGDLEVLPFTPASTVRGLALGTRVVCVEQHRRVIVISGGTGEPVGMVTAFAGASIPAGWLLCNGAAVSRTQYQALLAVIGGTYGTGNGSTTFNVPNLTGRVAVGRAPGDAEFGVLGQVSGSKTHTLSQSEMPAHNHDLSGNVFGWGPSGNIHVPADVLPGAGSDNNLFSWQHDYGWKDTLNRGGSAPHNNIQPSIALNYIIKAT